MLTLCSLHNSARVTSSKIPGYSRGKTLPTTRIQSDYFKDHDEYLHDLLDMDRLSVIFRGLGVREEDANFEDRTGTTPIARETIAVCSLPLSLSSILRLLKRASPL